MCLARGWACVRVCPAMGECGCECTWLKGDCEDAPLRVRVSVRGRGWVGVSVPGPKAGVSGVQGLSVGRRRGLQGSVRAGCGGALSARGESGRASLGRAVAARPRGPGLCSTAGWGAPGRSPPGAGIPSAASRLREWCGWRQCSVPRAASEAGCASCGSGRLLF